MPPPAPSPDPFNAYAILSLPFPPAGPPASLADIKKAYRTALLRWHPDKAAPVPASSLDGETTGSAHPDKRLASGLDGRRGSGPSIDDITAAYATLSSPVQRREHERALVLAAAAEVAADGGADPDAVFRLGLEVVDLDDMEGDEEGGRSVWFRGCRCGVERGFVVGEEELERADGKGEAEVLSAVHVENPEKKEIQVNITTPPALVAPPPTTPTQKTHNPRISNPARKEPKPPTQTQEPKNKNENDPDAQPTQHKTPYSEKSNLDTTTTPPKMAGPSTLNTLSIPLLLTTLLLTLLLTTPALAQQTPPESTTTIRTTSTITLTSTISVIHATPSTLSPAIIGTARPASGAPAGVGFIGAASASAAATETETAPLVLAASSSGSPTSTTASASSKPTALIGEEKESAATAGGLAACRLAVVGMAVLVVGVGVL
ncbi:hypothetical protein K490DRAFT_69059 [Saccharata proteae CBS 121410]|uniref:J domain-containing protein n=1 Tax=Saccharata proteae CBS 121410 TaxID=1314787 RepID=A0A9P4LS30_9PEZI|nr:hypothetical protein K490DRAFT_69059 [Saccharata proteae CBS 121410]